MPEYLGLVVSNKNWFCWYLVLMVVKGYITNELISFAVPPEMKALTFKM